MDLILVWSLFAVVTALVAQSKGRPFVTWLVFGALCWIVALPAILLLKPHHDVLGMRREARAMKECPRCAESVKERAAVCRYCGFEF